METRVARLSILDSYGVRWTHATFARDLLQNFFDSAADFRAVSLDVRADEGTVEIRGPETFDIDLLAYIGATTKTSGRTAGGFGEGFKICALIGARDFGLAITAGSGAHELAVFFDPVPLGRELCYRITTRSADPIAGSYVRLERCDAACIAAFQAAPAMFRHPDNPKLQEPLVVDMEQGVAAYLAPAGRDGELYYRRQLRGTARFYASGRERAVTLAHDGVIDELEGDRDRRDLPAEPVGRAVGMKLAPDDLHRVLLALMPYWKHGNDVLSGLLAAAVARKLTFAWPPRWLARGGRPDLVQFAERQGFSIALASFAALGMPTPDNHYTDLETRAPTPLEVARFEVVAGLYTELNGKPASTTKLEVFDSDRAAVHGQHLGDRVLVGARLLEKGFDAVAGTILHELAHETGGEEDIRFLRRLTNLLGAAVRAPEKIRAARRRYAVAKPTDTPAEAAKKPAAPAAPTAYMPELDGRGGDTDGVTCALFVPPGFPPAAAICAAIRAAAAEVGAGVWLQPHTVSGPIEAVRWGLPGVPSLNIGGVDPDPPADPALGYHLRTYGPDGRGLCPDPERIRAAIQRAVEKRITGRAATAAFHRLLDGQRERVQKVLSIDLKKRLPKVHSARARRDDDVRAYLRWHYGQGSAFSLDGVFLHGVEAAWEAHLRRTRRTLLPAADLFRSISAEIDRAVAYADTLLEGDPDYDDADAFERTAMDAARGAAVSSYAAEPGTAAELETRAEASFRAARVATTRVLDLDVVQDAKEVLLAKAFQAANLGWAAWTSRKSFDRGRFEEAVERASIEVRSMQRRVDEEGGFLYHGEVQNRLGALLQDPGDARKIRKNQRFWARRAVSTQAIRDVYDRALVATGDEIAAARRCLEEAAHILPEGPPVSHAMSHAAARVDDPAASLAPRRIPLALLDGYKVRWSRVTVARDIVQNFFDEVDDFDEVVVEVDAGAGVIEVRGPSRFDLEYLRYIGATTKAGRRAAGGFGEGFKVCALVLVRDFGCAVTAGSGAWEIRPVLQPMKLGRELCYDVRTRLPGEEHPGSFVRLEGADARLCDAFAGAKDLFRHPKNPRLQSPIYADEKAGIGVFEPPDDTTGDVFYRRQHRGTLRFGLGSALTFALDDRLDGIEGDRDRRDLTTALPMVSAVAAGLPDQVLADLVVHLRAYWQRGGKVLGALLAEASRRGLRLAFPRRWLARTYRARHLEQRAERLGFHLAVHALGEIGMPTVADRFAAGETPRPPTAVEAARMAVARDFYTLLAGQEPLFSRFRVVELEPPMHDFRGQSCVVPAASLAAAFGEGIAPCLARLACGTGLRSRRNADRLTALLEGAVLRAGTLAPFEERWTAAAVDPSREGVDPAACADDGADDVDFARPRVMFSILAPAGFPPAEAIRARIARLCAEEGAVPCADDAPVNGLRDALETYARGVPSVWIGGTEIEPAKGRRPVFEVRTFAAEGGARALVPGDKALRSAIRAELAKTRGKYARALARTQGRRRQGDLALERWLARHAPDEHQRILEARSLRLVSADYQEQKPLPHPAHWLALAIAKRDLPGIHAQYDDGELDASADEAYEDASDLVGELLGALAGRAPGLLESGPKNEGALQCLCERAQKAIEGGAADEIACAEAIGAAALVMEIWSWLDVVPLDAHCARTCVNEAIARLWEVPLAEAPAAARERFDDAVRCAIARHDQVDAEGNPESCYTLFQALGERYGRPPVVPPKSPAVANAVRAAWDEALAAGLGEVEAARRCLAAAAAAAET